MFGTTYVVVCLGLASEEQDKVHRLLAVFFVAFLAPYPVSVLVVMPHNQVRS